MVCGKPGNSLYSFLGRPVGTWVLISFFVKWSELCLPKSCKCTLKPIKHYVNSPIYIKKATSLDMMPTGM